MLHSHYLQNEKSVNVSVLANLRWRRCLLFVAVHKDTSSAAAGMRSVWGDCHTEQIIAAEVRSRSRNLSFEGDSDSGPGPICLIWTFV